MNQPLISRMTSGLQGNAILKVSNQVKDLIAKGNTIANYSIGDFDSKEFPIPALLADLIVKKIKEGHTTYPLSSGMPELKLAVAKYYNHYLGLEYTPSNEILVGSGTRPLMFAMFTTVVDPGDTVVYGAPSWNTNHYCHITQADERAIATRREDDFLLTVDSLRPHISEAVLVVLTSPSNPCGTVYNLERLAPICELILEENKKRTIQGRKPCYVLYDHIYWTLIYGQSHVNPVSLFPEMKNFTVSVDGISKSFAATGLRVGWGVGPQSLIGPMTNVVTHMGAWAPKPEQLATAEYLVDFQAQKPYLDHLQTEMLRRLKLLDNYFDELQAQGFAVESVPPQGGMHLSLGFHLLGKKTSDGKTLENAEDVREYLLFEAGWALVPFTAFGDVSNPEWFRASVSALPSEAIDASLPRLKAALEKLK